MTCLRLTCQWRYGDDAGHGALRDLAITIIAAQTEDIARYESLIVATSA